MRSRRAATVVLSVAASMAVALAAPADEIVRARPGISFPPGVPADLRALATATWIQFTDAFPARWECIPDVTVAGAWQLGTRADYLPDRREVIIRIPGTGPNLAATLVHEFAHHLELACPEQLGLRPQFLTANGLTPRTPWFRGPTWDRIPSELFAEATVQVVLGRTSHLLLFADPSAVAAIGAWGRGS